MSTTDQYLGAQTPADAIRLDEAQDRRGLSWWLATPMIILSLAFVRSFCVAAFYIAKDRRSSSMFPARWQDNVTVGIYLLMVLTFLVTTLLLVLWSSDAGWDAYQRRLRMRLLAWLRLFAIASAVLGFLATMIPDMGVRPRTGSYWALVFAFSTMSGRAVTTAQWIAVSSCLFSSIVALLSWQWRLPRTRRIPSSANAFPVIAIKATSTPAPLLPSSSLPPPLPAAFRQQHAGRPARNTATAVIVAVVLGFVAARGASKLPGTVQTLQSSFRPNVWIEYVMHMSEAIVTNRSQSVMSMPQGRGSPSVKREANLLPGVAAAGNLVAAHVGTIANAFLAIWALVCIATGFRWQKSALLVTKCMLVSALLGTVCGCYLVEAQPHYFGVLNSAALGTSFDSWKNSTIGLTLLWQPSAWINYAALPAVLFVLIKFDAVSDLLERQEL